MWAVIVFLYYWYIYSGWFLLVGYSYVIVSRNYESVMVVNVIGIKVRRKQKTVFFAQLVNSESEYFRNEGTEGGLTDTYCVGFPGTFSFSTHI